MDSISDKDKRRETDMAGWRLYDAEKVITEKLLAENERLREELAIAQTDAKRYRWLRDECIPEKNPNHTWIVESPGEEWDAAIDEAIRKEKTE